MARVKGLKCPDCGKKGVKDLTRHKPYCKTASAAPEAVAQEVKPKVPPDVPKVEQKVEGSDSALGERDVQELQAELDVLQEQLGIPEDEAGKSSEEVSTEAPPPNPSTSNDSVVHPPATQQTPKLLCQKVVSVPFAWLARWTKCDDMRLTSEETSELAFALQEVSQQYIPKAIKAHGGVWAFAGLVAAILADKGEKLMGYFEKNKRGDGDGQRSETSSGTNTG